AVWLHEYLEEFPDKQDELRYVLTSILPETSDSEFTWKDFQARINNELVAILGNFVNRVMVLSHKYFDGKVLKGSEFNETDNAVFEELKKYPGLIEQSLGNYRFREALAHFMNAARLGNKYLADEEPWKVFKTDEDRVKTVLNVATQIVANLAILGQPFLPKTSTTLFEMLDLPQQNWDKAGTADLIATDKQLGEVQMLFDKITDAEVEAQLQKLAESKASNALANTTVAPAKPNISFDDFMKMDIRIGTILEAEKVAKTKKLLKLKIDTGIDQRTVVSGIAEFFAPEDIVGKQVSILVNLEPREIKGIQSQGMILMAEDADGRLDFVNPTSGITVGSSVR